MTKHDAEFGFASALRHGLGQQAGHRTPVKVLVGSALAAQAVRRGERELNQLCVLEGTSLLKALARRQALPDFA